MFRLSNLITGLFGIVISGASLLGVAGLVNRNSNQLAEQPAAPEETPVIVQQPDGSGSAPRQVGQSAVSVNPDGTITTTEPRRESPDSASPTATNPSAPFTAQPEGGVDIAQPPVPATPSSATAVQLDPTPAAAPPATPLAEAQPPAPASPPRPIRAMW